MKGVSKKASVMIFVGVLHYLSNWAVDYRMKKRLDRNKRETSIQFRKII